MYANNHNQPWTLEDYNELKKIYLELYKPLEEQHKLLQKMLAEEYSHKFGRTQTAILYQLRKIAQSK